MIFILWDSRKLWVLSRSAGEKSQRNTADGFCGIKIDRNTDISRQGLVLIGCEIDHIPGIVDEIMPIDPRFTGTKNHAKTTVCRRQLEVLPVGVEDAVANDAGEIACKILSRIGAVKPL